MNGSNGMSNRMSNGSHVTSYGAMNGMNDKKNTPT